MYADIEQLVLSGELFNGPERSTSPTRSPSPDWGGDDVRDDDAYDAAAAKNAQIERMLGQPVPGDPAQESIGMGPGRTGVKGVIRDRAEAEGMQKALRARAVEEVRRKMERSALSARTWDEDERARKMEKAREEGVPFEEEEDGETEGRVNVWGNRKGRFGHLREVGMRSFVPAVEDERGVWVVIHLYDPSLDRCYTLDDTLSRLARLHSDTKFLRARAAALGFASTSASTRKPAAPTSSITRPRRVPGRLDEDDEDDEEDNDARGGEEEEEEEDADVDTDMLPTMLVYRDGDLVFNWVRVDWEADKLGVEELLTRHHVLPPRTSLANGTFGLPADRDEDEWLSDEDA